MTPAADSSSGGAAPLARLLPFVAPYRRRVALGLTAILGAAVVGLASPLVIGLAIDRLVDDFEMRRLVGYAALLVAVVAVQGGFSFVQRLVLVTVSRDVENDLRNRYFSHLELMPAGWFDGRSTGDLMARGTNDLQAVRMICGPVIMYGANTLFTGTGALLLMARIDWRLTLLSLATLPLLAVATRLVGQRIHGHFLRVQEQFSTLTSKVQENLSGARVVRSYTRENAEIDDFERLNREYVERNRGLIRWTAAYQPLLQVLVGLGFAAALWYGGALVSRGELSVGQFVSFNFFLARLVWPMIAIGWVMNLTQRGLASLERVLEVLDDEPLIEGGERRLEPQEVEGRLTVAGLTFTHPGAEAPALEDLEVEIAAGATVAIVGRTGSGKSTLLSMVPRLVDPPPGTLSIDGVDVREWTLASLRRVIGVVPQEPFLFSATVGENVAMGRPEATPEEIERAAHAAGLDEDLVRFPRGIDTIVGERGITLSGGQKQRVALARALVREPRVLVLDDALSAVDTGTEERILRNLREVFRGRTVLLVSHRVSAVREADQILVMEGGRIVDRGTHAELAGRGGLYAELHRRQLLEDELATV